MLLIFVVIKFNGDISEIINTIQRNRDRGGSGINLVPFRTIGTYTNDISSSIPFMNIIGNIVPFIPMGFIIPMTFASQRNIIKVMFFCLLLIFSLETLQFLFFLGSFDIDDIILNQLSCTIGYLLFITYKNIFKQFVRASN